MTISVTSGFWYHAVNGVLTGETSWGVPYADQQTAMTNNWFPNVTPRPDDTSTETHTATNPVLVGNVVNVTWVAVPVPPATLAQAAFQAAISSGCPIVSTGTPALSGTYPIDDSAIGKINAEVAYINQKNNGTFSNKQTSRGCLDTSWTPHIFPNTAEFITFAEAIAEYVDALETALGVGLAGGAWAAPTTPITIA